mmetsp:Transcript_31025/g.48821  ORF Transcript_31025/g.48821 Transcript_31025/m.48821 type:complete len:202 (+) Transcript_31025:499-1104(+)
MREFMLGKLEKGRAMAVETAKAVPTPRCGPRCRSEPSWTISGISTTAATVCETKVAMPIAVTDTSRVISQMLSLGRALRMPSLMKASRSVCWMACPNTSPPPSRNSRCQLKELKSCWVSTPEPNMSPMKSRLTMPRSPKTPTVRLMVDQAMTVPNEVATTKTVRRVHSFAGLSTMGGMSATSSGRSSAASRAQVPTTPATQ